MNEGRMAFIFEEQDPQRLDKFLVTKLPGYSRSRLQNLIRGGHVRVDDRPARKSGQELEHGMRIEIYFPPPEPTDLVPEKIELDLVFENENVMVVNKPAGMVVHPAAGHRSGTLVHAALAHAPEMEGLAGEKRPGVVHRLDKDTSGLILLAKNDRSHRWLQEQFRRRQVEKTYLALVDGRPPTPNGRVEAPIGRHTRQRKQMTVLPAGQGRAAVSEYHTLEAFPEHTLLEVHPITGRTHQIRVHLAFLKCPVVGDTVYGQRRPSLPLGHQFLHAFRLMICLPDETVARTFEAPLPDDLVLILEQLRSGSRG
jgi:23S rRNA pseudouridine1911/1915/1917 synthase